MAPARRLPLLCSPFFAAAPAALGPPQGRPGTQARISARTWAATLRPSASGL
jgi:hypothetical protein